MSDFLFYSIYLIVFRFLLIKTDTDLKEIIQQINKPHEVTVNNNLKFLNTLNSTSYHSTNKVFTSASKLFELHQLMTLQKHYRFI